MERLKSKPFLAGLGAVALSLLLAAVYFAIPSKAENPRLERYLPSDAVGFVEVNHLRAQALKIIDSEAWREFSKENPAASSLFMMGANHAGVLDASYAVALLGVGEGGDGRPEPQFVLVAEFSDYGARRTFERRVLSIVREAGEQNVTTKTEKYGEAMINVVAPDGRKGFSYAPSGYTLYFSNSTPAVKRALDVRAGKTPSLETNPTFAKARARSSAVDGMFGYLDGVALAKIVDGVQAGDGHKGVEAFRQLFHGVGAASVESLAFTSAFEDGRVVERFVVNTPRREGILATVAANPPTQQSLLALVPADAVAAFDASITNAPQTFDQMLALMSQVTAQAGKKGPADVLTEFTTKTGVDLRGEILGSLGTEFCAAQLASGQEHGGVFILNVRDEQAFSRAVAKFAEHNKRAVSEREYKGVAVRSVAGEKGHGIEYAFVGGNFVASGRGWAVERVIDTAQGGASLRASAAYASAGARAEAQPQFVYYNSNANFLNHLGRSLKAGDDQQFKTEGQRGSLRPSFAFGVTREDGFYVESRTPLGTFPRLLTAVTSKLPSEKQGGEDE